MSEEKKLLPCICGKIPTVETRDVEPQGDSWYGRRMETFVICECGICFFEKYFHEGFGDEARAVEKWNNHAAQSPIWIPVEERRPEADAGRLVGFSVTVLGLFDYSREPNKVRFEFKTGIWHDMEDGCFRDVTLWQPLPPAPTKGK